MLAVLPFSYCDTAQGICECWQTLKFGWGARALDRSFWKLQIQSLWELCIRDLMMSAVACYAAAMPWSLQMCAEVVEIDLGLGKDAFVQCTVYSPCCSSPSRVPLWVDWNRKTRRSSMSCIVCATHCSVTSSPFRVKSWSLKALASLDEVCDSMIPRYQGHVSCSFQAQQRGCLLELVEPWSVDTNGGRQQVSSFGMGIGKQPCWF